MTHDREEILNHCYAVFYALETRIQHTGILNSSEAAPDRRWCDEANIYSGYLGAFIFELQLYEATLDPKVLQSLLRQLEKLEATLHPTGTYNYSFAHGRMGLVYFYIQLYRCTGESAYLSSALKIVRQLSESHLIYFSLLSDCSVNNGAAGILMVLMELYVETKEDWLLTICSPYFNRIIQHIGITASGLSWDTPGIVKDEAGSLPTDTGIAIVLLALAHLFSADHLRLLMSNVFLNEPDAKSLAEILCNTAHQKLTLHKDTRHFSGLLLLEAYELSGKAGYLESSGNIVSEYLNLPLAQDGDYTLSSGYCGGAYLLLRWLMAGKSKLSDVFFPAFYLLAQPVVMDNAPEFLDEYKVRQMILESQFKISYKTWDDQLREKISEGIFGSKGRITLNMLTSLSHKNDLEPDLSLFHARFRLTANKPEEIFEEVLGIAKIITLDQASFMRLQFCVSEKAIVINEPGISKITPDGILHFFTRYGTKSIVCRMADAERLDVKVLNLSKLVFDNLLEPRTGNEISKRVSEFAMSQDAEIVEAICKQLGTTVEYLDLYLGTMVYEAIKSFMEEGMIEAN